MHKLSVASHTNNFPLAVGARISGVDDSTYSITGEAFSQIVAANSATHTARLLQEDDTSLGVLPLCMRLPSPPPSNASWLTPHSARLLRSLRICTEISRGASQSIRTRRLLCRY